MIAEQNSHLNLPPLPARPLVSIVTPSYNQAAYLEQTLLSVLDQEYPALEYLVADGGSTDGSVEIIRRHAGRLSWWVSENDAGQSDAINKGFSRARGEVVAWLNSDDYYLPGTVAAAVEALRQNPDACFVYGDMLAVDERGRALNKLAYHQSTVEDLLCFHIIGQPAVFMRAAALQAVGCLDLSYHCLLDHQLWLRLALMGQNKHIPQTWAAARYHPEAKNRVRAEDFGREAFRILDWAAVQPELAPTLARVARKARASAHRVDARYMLDGGKPWPALVAWCRALYFHPPTAFARLNLIVSALLSLCGLGFLRTAILKNRQARFAR